MIDPQHWHLRLPQPVRLKNGTTLRTPLDAHREMCGQVHPNGPNVVVVMTIDYLARAARSGRTDDVTIAASLVERFAAQAP